MISWEDESFAQRSSPTTSTTNEMEKKYTLPLDFIIELILLSQKANLDAAFKAGITYIWAKLRSVENPYSVSECTVLDCLHDPFF